MDTTSGMYRLRLNALAGILFMRLERKMAVFLSAFAAPNYIFFILWYNISGGIKDERNVLYAKEA